MVQSTGSETSSCREWAFDSPSVSGSFIKFVTHTEVIPRHDLVMSHNYPREIDRTMAWSITNVGHCSEGS